MSLTDFGGEDVRLTKDGGMAVTVTAGWLNKLLKTTKPAYQAKAAIPVLGAIRLRAQHAHGGSLEGACSNLDMQITTHVPAVTVDRPGDCLIGVPQLKRLVNSLPGHAEIEIEAHQHAGVFLRFCDTQVVHPIIAPASEFPDVLEGNCKEMFLLPELRTLFRRALPFVSQETTRYYLNGIYLHKVPGRVAARAVATDGHRLIYLPFKVPARLFAFTPQRWSKTGGFIVPRAAVMAAMSIDQPEFGLITVDQDGKEVAVRAAIDDGSVRIVTKLIDGTYPNYERVVPRDDEVGGTCTVNTVHLASALARISAVATSKSYCCAVARYRRALALDLQTTEGAAITSVPIRDVDGEIPPINLNVHYALEALRSLEADSVRLEFGKGKSAESHVITVKDGNNRILIMPMRGAHAARDPFKRETRSLNDIRGFTYAEKKKQVAA